MERNYLREWQGKLEDKTISDFHYAVEQYKRREHDIAMDYIKGNITWEQARKLLQVLELTNPIKNT